LSMRFGWYGANCQCSSLFPPVDRKALHDLVLDELLQDLVVSSRGRKVPRGVKRKMSNYNLRPRTPMTTLRLDYERCIELVK
jgi:hypothetical protein